MRHIPALLDRPGSVQYFIRSDDVRGGHTLVHQGQSPLKEVQHSHPLRRPTFGANELQTGR